MLSLRESIDRLRTHGGREDFSPLLGASFLAVDVSGDPRLDAEETAILSEALAELGCPSIGCGAEPALPGAASVVAHFDVVVESEEDFERVATGCRQNPLASLVLVQALRRSAGSSIHDGLVTESLGYATLQSGPEFAHWQEERGSVVSRVASATNPLLRVERKGERLELVLTRPEKRNAFCAELRDQLALALEVALVDVGVKQIVWSAEGPAFCAGGDLDEFGSLPDPATAHGIRSARNVARLVAVLAKRLRVEVNGACVGAGVELPAFAGHLVARRDAFFALPEIAMGLIPGAGGTVSLPRRIGRQRTAWMALSGARIDAETAYTWGLVDELTD